MIFLCAGIRQIALLTLVPYLNREHSKSVRGYNITIEDRSLLLKSGGKYSLLFFKRSPEKNDRIIFDQVQQKRKCPIYSTAGSISESEAAFAVKQAEEFGKEDLCRYWQTALDAKRGDFVGYLLFHMEHFNTNPGESGAGISYRYSL